MKTVNDYIRDLGIDNEALRGYLERDPVLGAIPVETMANLRRAGFYRRAMGIEVIKLHEKLEGEALVGVFLHEVAHAICRHMYGPSVNHGYAWQKTMRSLGQDPERLYKGPDLHGDKPPRFIYQCVDCGSQIKRHRFAPWMIPERLAKVHHRGCRRKPGSGRLVRVTEIDNHNSN